MGKRRDHVEGGLFDEPVVSTDSAGPHGLNPAQQAAVTHADGPLMVLSGPGTGKTRVITHRIAHLIRERGVNPESILALTFTVKTAAQMRERLAALVGRQAQLVRAYTLHGFGFRLARRFGPRGKGGSATASGASDEIIDSAQLRSEFRRIIKNHGLFTTQLTVGADALVDHIVSVQVAMQDASVDVESARRNIHRARSALERKRDVFGRGLDPAGLNAERARIAMTEQVLLAIEALERLARQRGWMSFGEMLTLPTRLLDANPTAAAIVRDECRHVVVDEFQDVNLAQIELLRRICPPASGPDLCVVGDDDQSIYGFRGADDRAMERFGTIWSGHAKIRLEENYRSRPEIIRVAAAIMQRAENRFDKNKRIVAGRDHDGPVMPVECVHSPEETQYPELIAAMILLDRKQHPGKPWSSYAVIGRSHTDLDRVAGTLRIEGVPVHVTRSASALDDEGVRDVLAWVELLVRPASIHAGVRLLCRPPMSADLRDILPLQERYRAAAARHEQGVPGVSDPGGFADWLGQHAPEAPGVATMLEHHRVLHAEAMGTSAADAVFRIITRTDPAHADLAEPRRRAERVRSLLTLVQFVRARQPRLEAPGDLRTFWAYFNDLNDAERSLRDSDLAEKVDGDPAEDADSPDAVRLMTAHSAKGLEFDTVFVPRISPSHGYGSPGSERDLDLPAGLLGADDERSYRERALAEERRVFYVACTRAERRLVLLAKKNKGRSQSMHLFEEIMFDEAIKDVVSVRAGEDILSEAGKQGVWRVGTRTPLDAERALMRAAPARREVFESARRDLRLSAAAALDLATGIGGEMEPSASVQSLGETVRTLAALDHAERTGTPPEWAARLGGAVLERVRGVLSRAKAIDDENSIASGPHFVAPPRAPLELSYSQIEAYRHCPRCFYVQHVLKLRSPASDAQSVGTAAHAALEAFYRELRDAEGEGREAPGLPRLLDIARTEFYSSVPESVAPDALQLKQLLAQLEQAYTQLHDPRSNVLELERSVRFPFDEHTLVAKIDRVDQVTLGDGSTGSLIIDYKTGHPRESLRIPKPDDLQLGMYAMALAHDQGLPPGEQPRGRAEYWLLATGERGGIDFAELNMDKVQAKISEAIEGILQGKWPRGKDWRDAAHECDILGPE